MTHPLPQPQHVARTHLDLRSDRAQRGEQQLLGVVNVEVRLSPAIEQRREDIQESGEQGRVSLERLERSSLDDDDESSVEGLKGLGMQPGVKEQRCEHKIWAEREGSEAKRTPSPACSS